MAKKFYCLVLSVLMLLSLVPLDLCATAWAEELPEVAESETVTETPVGVDAHIDPPEELAPESPVGADDSVRPNPAEETGSALPEETTLTAPTLGAGTTASGQCGDNVTWSLDDTGTLTISGTGEMWDYKSFNQPWYPYQGQIKQVIIGDNVTNIGERAFGDCRSLTDVTIPDGVTTIGDYAFYGCVSLADLTIPNSVTDIGDVAFSYCSNLTEITIPNSVVDIGFQAFAFCPHLNNFIVAADSSDFSSVEGVLFNKDKTELVQYPCGRNGSYTIPDSVTSIGSSAFRCCALKSVTIPNGVTSIGEWAFGDSDNLTSIFIPTSVTNIVSQAFACCSHLTEINVAADNSDFSSAGGVLFNKDKTELIQYPCGRSGSYTIPDSVTTIGIWSFAFCDNLRSVIIPESVTTIGNSAFRGFERPNSAYYTGSATQWESIVIGSSNEDFTSSMIYNYDPDDSTIIGACGDNVTWSLDDTGTLTISGTGDMWDYGGVWGGYSTAPWFGEDITSVVIEDGVTNVGDFAFYGCRELQSVSLPKSVTAIQYGAFAHCYQLECLTLPENLQTVGKCAFSFSNLSSISLPESVTDIQYFAFGLCTRLSDVTLPTGLTTLGGCAFYGCPSLRSVSLPDGVTEIQYGTFSYCSRLQNITLPKNLQTIGECAFARCENLQSLTLPKSVTEIQYFAFGWCSALQNVTLPTGLTSLGECAFYNCESLSSITVPSGIKNLPRGTFQGAGLQSVALPEGLETIGRSAFWQCWNLTSCPLPDSITAIGDYAFGNCWLSGDLVLPRSLVTLGNQSFACNGCGFTSITLPDSLRSIGYEAFWDARISNIAIPASLQNIAPGAFGGCRNLSSFSVASDNPCYSVNDGVLFNKDQTALLCYPWGKSGSIYTIPNGVTTVGTEAFFGCYNLHRVTIPDGVTTLDSNAFWNCYALESLSVPGSIRSWGGGAFSECHSLQQVTLGKGLTEIGNYAFFCCESLQSITIPATVKTIQDAAFCGSGLTSLTLPEGMEAIGSRVFGECYQLTAVSLPESLEYIGENAFAWCDNLTTATYPGAKAQWEQNVFVSRDNETLLDVLHFTDSLTVTGLTAAHNGMTIQLRKQRGGEVLASTTVKNGAYGVINLPDGVYTLSLSRSGYVTFDTAVTITNHTLALGGLPTLVKKGDVNGTPGADGRAVDVSDMQCLYDYLSAGTLTGQITDAAYFAAVADANEDGAVNILDYQALYEKILGVKDDVVESRFSMGTGGDQGTYYAVGNVLGTVINQRTGGNIAINVVSTGGSKDNLENMALGIYQLATVQSDVMSYAYNGTRSFVDCDAITNFRVLCGLYAETVQIVTTDASIKSVEDLKGKSVCVGDVGSGTYFNTVDILAAYDMTLDDVKPVYQPFGDSTDSLQDGKIAAAVITAGAPTPAVVNLSNAKDVYLISIDDAHMSKLLAACPQYASYTIPAGTYGIASDAVTITTKATLVCADTLSDEQAYAIVSTIFNSKADIVALHDKGNELDFTFATEGMAVPFHNGAAQFFAEQGITVNETETPVIKIGVFEPQTGDNGAGGKQEILGMQYANYVQPTVNIRGRNYDIQLEIVDNHTTANNGPAAAAELVNRGVSVVLGSYGSGVSMAGGTVFAEAGVPAIGVSCTNPNVTADCSVYYRICPLDSFEGTVLAHYAWDSGVRTAYTLGMLGNDYNQSLIYYFTRAFTALGGEVVSEDFQEGTSNFTSHVNNAKIAGAGVIFAPISINYAQLLIEAAAAQGFEGELLGSDTWDNNMVVESAKGKDFSIKITTFYQEGGAPDFDSGIKAWMNANPDAMTNNGGNDSISAVTAMGYDAYFTALEAIKLAGSTAPSAILAALPRVNYTGVSGQVAFDDIGDAIRDSMYIKTVNTKTGTWNFYAEQSVN